MFVQAQVEVGASKEEVWEIISNMEIAASVFKDIKSLEIIEKPPSGLLGLKWKEVRDFMGKEAEETMWIVEASENQSYTAEAKNSGCLYHSSIILEDKDNGTIVKKTFRSTPQSFIAKLMMPLMQLMKGTLRKCIQRDLDDLKSYLNSQL